MERSGLGDGQLVALLTLEDLACDQGLEVADVHFGDAEGKTVPLRISFAGYTQVCMCLLPLQELAQVDVTAIRQGLRDWLIDGAADAEKVGQELALTLFDALAREHRLRDEARCFEHGIGEAAFPLRVWLEGATDAPEAIFFGRSMIRRSDAKTMRAVLGRWMLEAAQHRGQGPVSGRA